MGSIRKQTILSSIIIYVGFFIGFLNTWFFIRNNSFSPAEYGLTRLFFDIGLNVFAFASFGVVPVIFKFFPYFNDRLERKKNDLLTWCMAASLVGFVLVVLAGWLFEPLIVRKFSGRSALLVHYYYWIFPFGFGMLLFSILEVFSWSVKQTLLPNFLKETGLRLLTLLIIVPYYLKWIDFDIFIRIFAFTYLAIAVFLFIWLRAKGELRFSFTISYVTKRYRKKMAMLAVYTYAGVIISMLAQSLDSIFIASLKGLDLAGVFNLAAYIANVIQVPQRSVISVTTPLLSQAWKDKNMQEIGRIYNRSAINLLALAIFIFGGIWLNIHEAFGLLDIRSDYHAGISVIFILAIARVIDAGTGVNSLIIATSTLWRFEFFTGLFLVLLMIPLNYILISNYGIIGSAWSNLISFSVYNTIRLWFIWYRFKLQPFSSKTVYLLLLGIASYMLSFIAFESWSGWTGIIMRSIMFSTLYLSGMVLFKISPDALALMHRIMKRKSD